MNKHINLGSTIEGEKLNLSPELEQKCQVVYKKADDDDGYVFYGLWDSESDKEYDQDYVIVPLRSVFNGLFDYTIRDVFANIIGSKDDPHPSGLSSWIKLLTTNNINCNQCVTDGFFYDPNDDNRKQFFEKSCGGQIIGGHVIKGFNAAQVAEGSTVYLLPICSHHNSYCTDKTGRNGAGFYMRPSMPGKGVKLSNYFQLAK